MELFVISLNLKSKHVLAFFLCGALLLTSCSHSNRHPNNQANSQANSQGAQREIDSKTFRNPAGRALPSTYTGGSEIFPAPASGKRIRTVHGLKGFRYTECTPLSSSVPECVSIPSSIPDCFRGDYTCAIEYAYLKWKNPLKSESNDEAHIFQCAAWNQTAGCACPKRYDSVSMIGYIPIKVISLNSGPGDEVKIDALPALFEQRHWFSTFSVVLVRKDTSGVFHYSRPRCTTIAPLQFEFTQAAQHSTAWPLSQDTEALPASKSEGVSSY